MAAVASLFAGSVSISAPEIARALLGGNETVREIIVWQLRVPRTLLAMLFSTRRALDALSLGEDTATSLGFNVGTVRLCGSGAGGGSGSSGSGGGLDTGSVRQQTLFLPIRRRHAVAESRARSSCASRS